MFEQINMMLSQITPNQEIQFLVYFAAVIIGIQLAIYFFYQYYKIQDVNLKLNRILLSFGSFTLLIVLGALFMNVSRHFVTNPNFRDFFTRVGWIFAFSAPIGFLSFIIVEEFSSIMNLKIVKILTTLSFIPIITVIVVPSTRSPIFIISIIFTLSGAYYILNFQIKLIKKSVGSIRKKILQFFIGEIISLTSLAFAIQVGLGILPPGLNEFVYYVGVAILLTGFIIMFFSANDFPPFYEFEWKENLLKLFIINQKDNRGLFYCDLSEVIGQIRSPKEIESDLTKSLREKLLTGGIMGIESIIARITDTKNEKINKIKHEDSMLLLDYGIKPLNITYALSVKKDIASHRHFLNVIKTNFESFYREILLNLDNLKEKQEQFFSGFNTEIDRLLKD
ncbi:MAG: hypothetical protein HWN67_15115 [Candidatus Helarchaeota archaeon]|nr:hypothetical protein [Candidatus Helarchaeota archaeon]